MENMKHYRTEEQYCRRGKQRRNFFGMNKIEDLGVFFIVVERLYPKDTRAKKLS